MISDHWTTINPARADHFFPFVTKQRGVSSSAERAAVRVAKDPLFHWGARAAKGPQKQVLRPFGAQDDKRARLRDGGEGSKSRCFAPAALSMKNTRSLV